MKGNHSPSCCLSESGCSWRPIYASTTNTSGQVMLICSDVRNRGIAVLISSLFSRDTNLSHFALKVRHTVVELAVVQFGILFSASIVMLFFLMSAGLEMECQRRLGFNVTIAT